MIDSVVIYKGKFPVLTAVLSAGFLGLGGVIAYAQFSDKWQALTLIAGVLSLISAIPTIVYLTSRELLAVLPVEKVIIKGTGSKKSFINYTHRSTIRIHAEIISDGYSHNKFTVHFVNLVDERGRTHLLFESLSKQHCLEIAKALCEQSGLKLVHNKSSRSRD